MIFDSIQQTLNEFFLDVTEKNVVFHLGDLFDPSQFRLTDVFLRTDLLNTLHLPFEIKGGYIGNVTIEGFVGLVTGSPLNIVLDNIVLVIGHKSVDWDNELVMRYARELLIAMIQSVSNPSYETKEKKPTDDSSMSPMKWITSKMQAALADTTIKLERIHIRFESEQESSLIAYGIHIPIIQVTTRDMNDQILHRRDQLQGITYPKAGENSASKLVYCGNSSIYCDLNATSFTTPSSLLRTSSTTKDESTFTPKKLPNPNLAYFRTQCLERFQHDPDRDLITIAAWWFKVDMIRSKTSQAWVLAALDVVTDKVTVNVDFAQLTALTDELTRVTEFFERTKRHTWRPSCIDRERVVPPSVTVSSSLLLPRPLGTEPIGELLPFGIDKQHRSREWLRGMWRYAARCVLYTLRKGTSNRVQLFSDPNRTNAMSAASLMMQQQHYIDLYRRSLDHESLKMIVDGRGLNSKSPKTKTNSLTLSITTTSTDSDPFLLPQYPPLSLQEQWEFSDMVQTLPIYEQRVFRSMASSIVRAEAAALASLHSSPKRSNSSKKRELGIPPPPSPGALAPQNASMNYSSTVIPSNQPFSRSLTEANVTARPHPASPSTSPTHSLHTPQRAFSKQQWFLEALLPPVLLAKTATVPLVNWYIGEISIHLHHRELHSVVLRSSSTDSSGSDEHDSFVLVGDMVSIDSSISMSSHSRPCTRLLSKRWTDMSILMKLENCTGSILFCTKPSFLIELRLGRFHTEVCYPSAGDVMVGTESKNAITTDYIMGQPSDGFMYLGLKYNFKSSPSENDEPQWDLKAKLCVGAIHINYDEMALHKALEETDKIETQGDNLVNSSTTPLSHPSFSRTVSIHENGKDRLLPIRIETATHFTLIQDVLGSWKAFLERVRPTSKLVPQPIVKKKKAVSAFVVPHREEEAAAHTRATKHARLTKLLNAVMQQCSLVEADMSGIEVQLSMLTSHVEQVLDVDKSPVLLSDSEQVTISLPPTSAGLQNRPHLNECQFSAGGAKITFRTTKQGRAAVLDHILKHMSS